MSILRKGDRDFRIDFFRGLALLFIFVDHVPDNVLANFTLKNFGFADAAEVFVLLAGYSAVLAYGRAFETEGFRAGTLRVLRRGRDIYLWHLGLLLICGFGLVAIAHLLANPSYIDGLKLYVFAENPPRAFALAATLANQPNLLNILPLYVALFVFWAPLLLWLVVRWPFVALAVSVAVWALANVYSLNLPSHQHPEGWVFNPFAWQLLMTIGAVAARFNLRDAIPFVPALAALAGAYIAFALLFAAPWALVPGYASYRLLPADALGSLDRIYLPAWRLLHILALGYLALTLLSAQARWLTRPWAVAVAHCGRHSLEIFCLATVLSLLSWVYLVEVGGKGLGSQMLVNLVGVSVLLATAWALTQGQRGAQQLALVPRGRVAQPTSEAVVSSRANGLPAL
jgi:hypothetical protein